MINTVGEAKNNEITRITKMANVNDIVKMVQLELLKKANNEITRMTKTAKIAKIIKWTILVKWF